MFSEFAILFKLDDARSDLRSAQENLCSANKRYGALSDESRKWREVARKDAQRVDVLERTVEKKKAYLFG